ncbi:MAG TPA: molybdenum cofactor synthesis domain-containing protein [Myxococcota bacterium]|nr:molybdenum cofactor synthesis domain-containing protein [Myxococcota bacterium]
MSSKIEIFSVNVSEKKGTVKHPVERVELDEMGIVGDAHAGAWHRQVSLLAQESVLRFIEQTGRETVPGEFAENITLRGFDLRRAGLLDRFQVGERVELELTQIGKKCHGDSCAIFRDVGRCVMPKEGVFCRVLKGGGIAAGDTVGHTPKIWRFSVITLSDRAQRGEYEDLSGPRAQLALKNFAVAQGFRAEFGTTILPDDASALRSELEAAREGGCDIMVTTGGTGIGPRDITPEVVGDFCDKHIPGIMEAIRVKFGTEKPNALLSRSLAGVAGQMLVYSLPGSVKAVDEYMGEIVKTLRHSLLMLHAIDAH